MIKFEETVKRKQYVKMQKLGDRRAIRRRGECAEEITDAIQTVEVLQVITGRENMANLRNIIASK